MRASASTASSKYPPLLGGLLLDRLSIAGMYGVVGAIILSSLVVFLIIDRSLRQNASP